MTDKQIIIDGVNVACCVRLQDDEISCDLGGECKGWGNCYYKQIQREKQTSQETRDTAIKEFNRAEELRTLLQRKEQECEELKKELEAIYDDCKGCPTCNEALYNANLYAKEYRKFKQTLAEIKEIAENVQSFVDINLEDDVYTEMNKILQKINEYEGNNDNK